MVLKTEPDECHLLRMKEEKLRNSQRKKQSQKQEKEAEERGFMNTREEQVILPGK